MWEVSFAIARGLMRTRPKKSTTRPSEQEKEEEGEEGEEKEEEEEEGEEGKDGSTPCESAPYRHAQSVLFFPGHAHTSHTTHMHCAPQNTTRMDEQGWTSLPNALRLFCGPHPTRL